jgi:hypothetical protein
LIQVKNTMREIRKTKTRHNVVLRRINTVLPHVRGKESGKQ